MDPSATTYLAPSVFAAIAGEDLVLLDVERDQYHCLADAGAWVTLAGRTLSGPPDLLAALTEAGLAASVRGSGSEVPLPPPCARTLEGGTGARLDLRLAALFWVAESRARRMTTGLPLADVLVFPGPERGGDIDLERVRRTTASFVRWLPWVPRQGACLYRAAFLRRLLRLDGQDAVWVFGVRTWPFAAHCWLQVGDAVLDDDVDRVRRYTPIMAV